MPPRKRTGAVSTAAGEDQGPSLKVIFEKGPLAGTAREFKPGSTVNIGRLVRGNTFAVKDAGVSSKHLLIQADAPSDSDGRRWTATDLDSSNGTILNDVQLGPSEPVLLSGGDVIKIGEETSIRIEMVDNEAVCGMRRNERRRVRGQLADLVIIDEDAELGLQEKGNEEKIEVEAKQGRNVRTRNSKKIVDLAKDLNVEEDTGLGKSEIKESRGVSTRRTRSSASVEEIEVDLSVIEGKKTTRGGRGRKKLSAEAISQETDKEEPDLQHETHEEDGASGSAGVQEHNDKLKRVADLEKMTLGEWLDFLMEYEPRQIIAETEEMLAEMRQTAMKCHELIIEHKKTQKS